MDLDAAMLGDRAEWPAMPAMQTPSILDWRLSPGSFSMNGALLIGEDGCETMLPANLATRLIRFRQLVRTTSYGHAAIAREKFVPKTMSTKAQTNKPPTDSAPVGFQG